MFPFHRKHGNTQSSCKQSGKRRFVRDNDEVEMSDEEYRKYVQRNDNSRHQSTRGAHDRYCNRILREKEGVLLSGLSSTETLESPTNSFRFGPSNNNIFKCLLNQSENKHRESISMPSSPVDSRNSLGIENTSRRKSDTMADANCAGNMSMVDEYILTLKIDDLASTMDDVSFYRIGPKLMDSPTDYSQLSDNCDYSPVKIINYDSMSVQYREVDLQTSVNLKKLLIGSKNKQFPNQWMRQCFSFCHISASRWRLVQIKPGCCGIIAAVEAFLIKSLLFEPGFCKFKEPLRPNQKEVVDAFIHALSYILWQAGDFERAVIITPRCGSEIEESESYLQNGVTDSFIYAEYFDFDQLKEAVATNMKYFTNSPNHGYLNFVVCVILSRGISRVESDMDYDVSLITENGHCSLELVMLLITGKAISNVFDNDIRIDSCLLKGVKKEVDVGLLSLFEHLNTCEVGTYLKSPKFPVWLVNYTDHFTVLFSSKLEYAQHHIEQPFVLYHYDSMTAFSCDNDIKLVIDPLANFSDDQLETDQTHLQLCIRTKWKNAIVIYAENSELFLV